MKINFGCGSDIRAGWMNIDMLPINHPNYIQRDLKLGFPTFSEPVELIYSAHVLEHFTFNEGQKLLKSCFDTLSSGGTIRICLPDFKAMVKAYLDNNWDFFNVPEVMHFAPDKQMMQVMNYGLYQRDPVTDEAEHKCMYDVNFAIFALTKAGFMDAKEVRFDPQIDQHCELRKRYSFYVKARKN